MSRNLRDYRVYRKLSLTTLIATYLLILVGGIVRSTGSGMGCPDWPKCFGSWVPPTSERQLPADYKDIYSKQREEKNMKFIGYLKALGFKSSAAKIEKDESILVEADFNRAKTWTEYINRLIGAIIGILVFSTFVSSLRHIKTDRGLAVVAGLAFVLVGFQGWIGSIVVSTNLLPWTVTLHMLIALVIIAILTYMVFVVRLGNPAAGNSSKVNMVLTLCMATMAIQIVLGTQVREAIDTVAASLAYNNRDLWIGQLGTSFFIHRSFSLLILVLHIYLIYILYKTDRKSGQFSLARAITVLVVAEIAFGAVMAYFAIPPAVQPLHLLFATMLFGMQFYLFLELNFHHKRILTKAA